jgi:glutaredoxin
MRIIPLMVALALVLAGNAQAQLYRSIDKDGNVHYSDTPLPGSEDVAEVKVDKVPVSDESLPYETRRAKENFPVTLYGFPDCGSACKLARDYLNKRGIPYSEKSLTKQEDIDAFRKESGDSQLPAMSVGKTWVKGFLEERWAKELDIAGYPKAAGARPPKVEPPAAIPAQAEQ